MLSSVMPKLCSTTSEIFPRGLILLLTPKRGVKSDPITLEGFTGYDSRGQIFQGLERFSGALSG